MLRNRQEVTADCRKMLNKELHDLHCSLNMDDEMGWARGKDEREHKCRQNLVGQPEGNRTPGRPGHGRKNKTKTILKE
jgi:hypothetical protein